MSIRCAVVCPIASGGGITEAFFTSLAMLASSGVTPVAIVPEAFVFIERLRKTSFETHCVKSLERGGDLRQAFQARGIANAVRRANVDIVVLNNGRHVRLVKWFLRNKPVVAIYHCGKTRRFLSADRVITINDEQLDLLAKENYPPQKCAIVDNSLPLDSLPPFEPKLRHRDGPVIGTLRLLEPAKGVDLLIEAIAILAARGKRFRTRIGSTGSQDAQLKARVQQLGVSDIIEFSGWVADKSEFFESLDIYVLPSRSEEWGIGIVEANAARLPVIATACLGPKRIIKNGETGILVPLDDALAIANAIENLAERPDFCMALTKSAYARVESMYLFPRIAPVFAGEVLKVLETFQGLKKK